MPSFKLLARFDITQPRAHPIIALHTTFTTIPVMHVLTRPRFIITGRIAECQNNRMLWKCRSGKCISEERFAWQWNHASLRALTMISRISPFGNQSRIVQLLQEIMLIQIVTHAVKNLCVKCQSKGRVSRLRHQTTLLPSRLMSLLHLEYHELAGIYTIFC